MYHHTAPVNMNYAIREGLRLIANEGLDNIWKRHNSNAIRVWKGLENLGIEFMFLANLDYLLLQQ